MDSPSPSVAAPSPTSSPVARPRHRGRTLNRRAVYAILAVVAAEVIGTVGFHALEGMRWVDAFYFESMLATGQGPPIPLATDAGKVFASFMGFVSVGSVLSAFIFTIGPIVTRWWRESLERVESESRRLERGVESEFRRVESEFSGHRPPPSPPSN